MLDSWKAAVENKKNRVAHNCAKIETGCAIAQKVKLVKVQCTFGAAGEFKEGR